VEKNLADIIADEIAFNGADIGTILSEIQNGTYGLSAINTAVLALENKLKAVPSVDSILFKSGGLDCPAGKSIWNYLIDINSATVDLLSMMIGETESLLWKEGGALCPTGKSIWDYLPYLDVAISSRAPEVGGNLAAVKTDVDNMQVPIKFTSAETLNDIAVTAATDTTEKEITVSLPAGASIVKVMLAALITVMNNSANAQKIDVDVKGRVSGGSWSTFFSQDDCIGFPAADGATTGFVPTQDVTTLVTGAGTYGFKLTIQQSSANSVRYTTQYVLIVTYKMS